MVGWSHLAHVDSRPIRLGAGRRRRISNTRTAESLAVFADLAPLLAESRKAFALEARKYPELQVYLFMLADAKPIAAAVLRNCEPA